MNDPKIVLYDFEGEKSLSDEFREELRHRSSELRVVETAEDYSGKLGSEHLEGAQVLISRVFDDYPQELFQDSEIEYIGVMATDKSHYPLDFLEDRGIEISNAPEYARESVAELTVNMMLTLSLNSYMTTDFVESGKWDVGPFPGKELRGKKLGIIGLGSIGSRVAEIASGLGMEICYNSRSEKEFAAERGWKFLKLNDLISKSDVNSIHCSLNRETENLLNKEILDKIEGEKVILNGARSEIQDVEKTIELCERGRLKVWFDALEDQEQRENLLSAGNAVLTSHSGCATKEAKERLKQKTLENLDNYLGEK
ncbi:MAG: 2-hydroxyacid dehydrogenase [Candidatus Nanohaloarchaea archaeon]